jgi:hypothetical protein
MAIPPPPGAPVQKKRGLGCCGCGCLILAILLILVIGFFGGIAYLLKTEALAVTSEQPEVVQTFDGGDDLYHAATQKLSDFDQALQQHKQASLHLNANEINTLAARSPFLAATKIHLFVAITDDRAQVQASLPTNLLFHERMLKDRYFNLDSKFGINFYPAGKTLSLTLQTFMLGNKNVPADNLPALQSNVLNPFLNAEMQQDEEAKKLLDQAKSIEIKDGELVIDIN